MLQNHFLFTRTGRYIGLANILRFEYLIADIARFYCQTNICLIALLFGFLLQFIEAINAILCLVCACLRHTAHPFQLGAIEVARFLYLGVLCFDTFSTLFHIIGIIAVIGIERMFV